VEYTTQVLPRDRRYENEIARDLSMMFLGGVSTRTLSILSHRLIGRKLSHAEISSANTELVDAVEKWRSRDLSCERVFEEKFPKARIQHCQVHVARNVLAKVPKRFKKAVADDMRTIFYTSSRKKGEGVLHWIQKKWERDLLDGTSLEIESHRKSTKKPAHLESDQRIVCGMERISHKIVDTTRENFQRIYTFYNEYLILWSCTKG